MAGFRMMRRQEKQRRLNYISIFKLILTLFQCLDVFVEGKETESLPLEPNTDLESSFINSSTPGYMYNYSDVYNPEDLFKLDTLHCSGKSMCSDIIYMTFPDTLCYCDNICGLFNDCCSNYNKTSSLLTTSQQPFSQNQFECIQRNEIIKNKEYGVTMVTKCSSEWDHNVTKNLCETKKDTEDILLRLPVTDKTDLGLMYKNMYCAQCNFIDEFYYWRPELLCRNQLGAWRIPGEDDCVLFFLRPKPEVTYRTCQVSPSVISTCPTSAGSITDELLFNCTQGTYSLVYDESGKLFRNQYCGICNGVKGQMYCDNINILIQPPPTIGPRELYSFRLLVDFNTGIISKNDKDRNMRKCKSNEMYDIFSRKCRKIFCAPPRIPTNGVCNNTIADNPQAAYEKGNSEASSQLENCTLTRLDPSEFEFINNSDVFIFSQQKVYSSEKFTMNGTDVFICLEKLQDCTTNCIDGDFIFHSGVVESYLSLFGLVISIICLAATLVVYIAFPQLLNTPGKILVSLIISLLLAQLLFLTAPKAESVHYLCFSVGVFIHYFFLAAFCWMNVIAFDLWMTFSNKFVSPGSDSKGTKRFVMYSLYAWFVPVVIVLIAVILDLVNFDEQYRYLKPGYGRHICWISSKESLLLLFAGPLALFKLFDIVSFVLTAVHIARAREQARMATHKKNTCSFIINIKLSLIMGLTWVFAFVANVTNVTIMWYLFIIFNSLQGLFIAICFLFTMKVGRLMRDKYEHLTSKYTSSIQTTTVT